MLKIMKFLCLLPQYPINSYVHVFYFVLSTLLAFSLPSLMFLKTCGFSFFISQYALKIEFYVDIYLIWE